MDNMDDLFDDIEMSKDDFEIAEIVELLHNHPDIFNDEMECEKDEIAVITELMNIDQNLFEVSISGLHLFCF